MRTVRNQSIGLAITAMSNPYFADVAQSIEAALSQAGFSLLLTDTHDDPRVELRAVMTLLTRPVDALILAPSADPSAALQHARQRGVPVVLLDRMTDFDFDQVTAESTEATAVLVEHLAHVAGHTKIAMISGKPGLATTMDSVLGYRTGLERNGLSVRDSYVVSGQSTSEGAAQALHKLLSLKDPPTAVVAGNNRMTIGAVRAARDASVSVPQDLALVAFDDFPWADLIRPRLTVMSQPTRAIGQQAAELVLSRLRNPEAPVRRVVLESSFVHRESCGCPPPPHSEPPWN